MRSIIPRRRSIGPDPATHRSLGDDRLVELVAMGDEQAIAELYRRHAPACFGLARRLLYDEAAAEDVLHDVMVALWERPGRFDPHRGALRPFLLRLTHGKAVDRLRSESRRSQRERNVAEELSQISDDIDREVWEMVRAETVRRALEDLSDVEREAIELAYFGGHTYRDVATMLGVPEGTVKGRIRLGMRKLADALESAGLGPDHRPAVDES